MKASYQFLDFRTPQRSILCERLHRTHFVFYWHYHPEIELTYVVRGKGTRLVGDSVEHFESGDLVLLGSNVPHTWVTEKELIGSDHEIEVICLQFPLSVIEPQVSSLPELGRIGALFRESARGMQFAGEGSDEIKAMMVQLTESEGFESYNLLMTILNRLSQIERRPLSSELYIPNQNNESQGRIGMVCTYIYNHYTEHLEVPELAKLADMNETAFCRFFKKMTGKTAVTYINDLRIGKACELLQNESLRIRDVGYRAGYNSITHFNRSFIKRKGTTPSDFRKQLIREQVSPQLEEL